MRVRFAILALAATAGLALAQDPPSRVARLNWMSGTVSFQPAGVDTWAEASLNYPLTTGDHLYTDSGARAEMHIGPNAIRIDRESNFGFLNLDDRGVQMRFTEGAVEIRLRHMEEGDAYEIDTPNCAVTLLQPGDYRIDTDPSRDATMVTVFRGQAEAVAGGATFTVHTQETGYFPQGRQPDVRGANAADDFDHFTASRNLAEDRMPPPVHVSESMVGYQDLDQNGSWRETPDYGWVWAPRVNAGWAPYRVGRWAWVEPWGWTWIDDAAWGFAPFHYGRWATVGGGWVWVPGARTVRPVYAPALVVFAGGGRIGGGAVAWFPLGPREVYRPAHTSSERYLREVNMAHVTNINVNVTNVTYVNQQSVTVVPRDAFVGARRVHEVSQQVDGAGARAMGSAPGVDPERQSRLVSTRGGGNVAVPRANVMSRPVVARTPPPAGVVGAPPVRMARPVDRFESRPPNAPATGRIAPMAPPQPAPAPVPQQPGPQMAPRMPGPRREPEPASTPVPQPVQRPQMPRREAEPLARPQPAAPPVHAAPAPEPRPEPRAAAAARGGVERKAEQQQKKEEKREVKKEEKHEEKKP